ncbi:hypothetical protein L6452_13199 [Arctium lappa]|uniref:Uncharacterized protein n=1 Tax=Arctium lappa TaxID=4217 RepID=A0ACB9CHJ7_ARCLA|nr:hypothetical protein L6452_13199 [Arctium lappa]
MRSEGFLPDAVTLVILLSCFASFGDLRVGSSLHAYSIKRSLSSDTNVYIGTALVHFYAKCGKLGTARRVFDGMGEKNTVSWNALISVCTRDGRWSQVYEVRKLMKLKDLSKLPGCSIETESIAR